MIYDVFISYNSEDQKIAEAACHIIEERRLRCFIAPRDITQSDWAGNLDAAIESSKAFVIIVSENSIASREVAKEIALATRVSDYIFPFRIDRSELNGRMNYHLSAFHWIDAVTPPVEEKLNELADRIVANLRGQIPNLELGSLSGNRNKSSYRLLGQSIAPRADFLGRNRELQALHQLLQTNNAVFLTGIGGIGKSEIARAYAQEHRQMYSTAIFATYEVDLLHLIASDQALPVENLQQAVASGGQGETTEDYFQRKMKVLRSIVNEHTLLIIDNFDVESDPHLEEVLQLPCKQIWTTRTDFSSYGLAALPVGPLDDIENLVTLMGSVDKIYTAPEDQAAIRDIIGLLDRHTLAVSLTAAQMKAGNIKPRKMLAQLQTEGLNIKTRSTFSRKIGGQRATAYGFIRMLFDFSKVDDVSCDILRYLACMPRDGVDIDLFMECCGIEDFGDIQHLVELNWVQMDGETDRIGLHMLVKELVWDLLTPTEENCSQLLEGAKGWAFNAWNKHYEENCSHSSILFSLLEAFPAPPIQWLDHFEELATFAWIMGRFDLSERCELHLYQLCVTHHGALSVQAGNQALRVAAVYHNQGDYAKARPWYIKGLEVQESIDPESIESYTARQKVARSNAQLGRYEEALLAFERNLEIIRQRLAAFTGDGEPLRKLYIHLASSQKYVAQIYTRLGRCEEALPLALEAHEYSKSDKVEPSLVVYSLTTLVNVYEGLGDYEKAAAYAQEALEENIRYHGLDRIDNVFLYEVVGDLCAQQGLWEKAEAEYTRALVERERLFPADTKSLERLEEKLSGVQNQKPADFPFLVMWT
jgi:tetratricopeptide (TPR) repeat protein